MSEAETKKIVATVLAANPGNQDLGFLMKECLKTLAGRGEARIVSELLKKNLGK